MREASRGDEKTASVVIKRMQLKGAAERPTKSALRHRRSSIEFSRFERFSGVSRSWRRWLTAVRQETSTSTSGVVAECIFSRAGCRIDSRFSPQESRRGGLAWLRGKERKTIAEDLFSLSRRRDVGCCDVYAQQQPPSRLPSNFAIKPASGISRCARKNTLNR